MEDVRWPAEQLEEHRLEISNRIRNLFWTVSGDYDMEFEPDTEKYVYSKQTVLYEAVKQGAFARYFDQKKLGMYLMKKLHFSAGEDMLLPLAGLCMDAAVNRFIIRERLGTKEIREQAFRELEKAEEEQVSDKAGTDLIHRIRLLYIRHVLENTDDEGMDPQAEIAFSCPRLRPIINNDKINPMDVHEKQLLQVVTAYRLFMPYASITVSTRECARVRDSLMEIAATKISAGVNVGIGGHSQEEEKGDEQFEISDGRSVDEIYQMIEDNGMQPVMTDYIYV